jgi:hypothetical protein
MTRRWWLENLGWALLAGFLAFVVAKSAQADIITELGAGMKYPATTSVVLQEVCHEALVTETRPPTPSLDYRLSSCGGDNPVFIGWPVAWESTFSSIWTVRAGWFHLSHWFDGGSDREVHMDALVVTTTFNWTEWRKVRRGRN